MPAIAAAPVTRPIAYFLGAWSLSGTGTNCRREPSPQGKAGNWVGAGWCQSWSTDARVGNLRRNAAKVSHTLGNPLRSPTCRRTGSTTDRTRWRGVLAVFLLGAWLSAAVAGCHAARAKWTRDTRPIAYVLDSAWAPRRGARFLRGPAAMEGSPRDAAQSGGSHVAGIRAKAINRAGDSAPAAMGGKRAQRRMPRRGRES